MLNLFADHERFIRHEVQALLVAGGFPWVNAMVSLLALRMLSLVLTPHSRPKFPSS